MGDKNVDEKNDAVKGHLQGFPLPKASDIEIKSIKVYADGDVVMLYKLQFFKQWVTKRSFLEGDK